MAERGRFPEKLLALADARILIILPLFAFVLFVNGALPGLLTPGMGIVVWLTGFAQSLANAEHWSLFAHDIGLPEPAAISFGLPGALVAAAALKLGFAAPDAYSAACAIWLAVAFWGAYSLARHMGNSNPASSIGAAIWLTFPIVWQHAGYSMLSIGVALIPTYYYFVVRFLDADRLSLSNACFVVTASIVAAFMDGYSYVMYASIVLSLIVFQLIFLKILSKIFIYKYLIVILSFIFSYYLYSRYIESEKFISNLSFFRGWGVDISFIVTPHTGLLAFFDALGLSVSRNPAQIFGDSSVYQTTFFAGVLAVAFILLISPCGNRRLKILYFAVALISVYLALGPSFKFNATRPEGMSQLMPEELALGPTGTAFLWEYVPGLRNMRAVYRWVALGIVALWCVVMVAMADKRLNSRTRVSVLLFLLVMNVPHFGSLWSQYSGSRDSFLAMERDIASTADKFRLGELVAFLPAGNDFLINLAGPKVGIRTYNIGGDKNAAIAREHWPREVREAAAARTPEHFAMGVFNVLNAGTDAVGVPYIDLLLAAHRWPYPKDRFEEMQPNIRALQDFGLFDITDANYFAIVRLAPSVAALPVEKRHELIVAKECPVGPRGISRVRLVPGNSLLFSDGNNMCGEGWSGVENWGRWTDGGRALLHYDMATPASDKVVEFSLTSYVFGEQPIQRIGIRVNGEVQPDWVFTRETERQVKRVAVPDGATEIRIEFTIPDARSPKQAGQSGDERLLGIGVTAVCLTDMGEACLTQ